MQRDNSGITSTRTTHSQESQAYPYQKNIVELH